MPAYLLGQAHKFLIATWKCGAIIALSIIPFGNALNNPLLWDDIGYIKEVPLYRDWHNIWSVIDPATVFKLTRQPIWRPILPISFFLNYSLWGLAPYGWRLFTIALHVANSLLVYALISRIGRKTLPAFFAACLFATHPTHHEAIVCVALQSDLWCCLFLLLAFHVDIFFRQAEPAPRKTLLPLSALLYAAALFSKETAVIYIPILALYDWTFARKQMEDDGIKWVLRYSGLFIVSALYFVIRFILFRSDLDQVVQYHGGTFLTNAMTTFKIFAYQIKFLILPFPLSVDYAIEPVRSLWNVWFITGALFLGCIVRMARRLSSTAHEFSFALYWTLITLLPVMNFRPLWNPFAERYLYIPSVGFCWFIGLGVYSLSQRSGRQGKIFWHTAIALLLLCYSSIVFASNRAWKDGVSLWTETLKNQPMSDRAHANLAREYYDRGRYDLAERENLEAIRLAPGRAAVPYNNLALIYQKRGLLDRAEKLDKAAMQADPEYPNAYNDLALLYQQEGRPAEAIRYFERALELAPLDFQIYTNLAVAYSKAGRIDKAIQTHQAALRINPDFVDARVNLGAEYMKEGRYDEAIRELQIALKLRIGFEPALYNLASVYFQNGDQDNAVRTLKRLLTKNPDHILARKMLAGIYLGHKNYGEAISELKSVLKLAPDDIPARNMLHKLHALGIYNSP